MTSLYVLWAALLPITRPALVTVGGQPVYASDALLVLLYLAWAVRWLRGRARLAPDRVLGATLLYAGVCALSWLGSGEFRLALALKWAAYCGVLGSAALSARVLDSEDKLTLALRAWLLGGLLAVAIGVAGFLAFYLHRPTGEALMCGYGGIASGNYPRLCAPFRHPNMFANYLAVALPLWAGLPGTIVSARWRWPVLGLGLGVAVFTMSAGVAGIAVGIVLALWAARRHDVLRLPRWFLRLAAAGAALGVVLFFVASIAAEVPPHEAQFEIGGRSVSLRHGQRAMLWAGTLPTIAAHPVLGQGYGTLVSRVTDPRAYLSPDGLAAGKLEALRGQLHLMEAHNVWLNVLGQCGVVGLAAFVFLLWTILRVPRDALLAVAPRRRLLRDTCLAAVVGALFVHGLFGGFEEARHVWGLLGLVVALQPGAQAAATADGPAPDAAARPA